MKKIFLFLAITVLPLLCLAQGWPDNYGGVMMQAFSWNSFDDTRWVNLTSQADEISQYFDLIWIPQSGWTGSGGSMGYDAKYYFYQKSAFGTETELRELINIYKNKGTGVIADVVVNHRGTLTNWVDFPVETYNGHTYQMTPADICKNDDGGNTQTWLTQQQALGNIPTSVSLSNNYDEGEDWGGMRDLDHKSENVRNVIKAYVSFLANDLGYTGFRYDMTRGFGANRVAEYNAAAGVQFSVGENWSSQNEIQTWIDNCKWNGVNMSASFDFPFRYTVRDVIRGKNDAGTKKTWKDLTIGGLMSTSGFKRYAVTFVENHDTQYRDEGNQNDPLRSDTLAANAYLLTMPGTPCVFLPHWKDYKQEIKNMIDVRKAVGVTNTSTAQKYPMEKSYELAGFKSSGANGKSMYCIVGKQKYLKDNVINQYYSSILSEAVEVTKGYGYRLYMSKNCETAWCDKASGKYDEAFDAKVTAVTESSEVQLVYTLDGSTPTANSTQVSSGSTVRIHEPCTLKVGILKGSEVSGIITRIYDFADQGVPHTINVYVNADDAGWNQVRYYTWDQDDQQHNGNWPGEIVTDTAIVGDKIWFVKQYEIDNDNCYLNFIFNTGTNGSPQTVDVTNVISDKFYLISTDVNLEGKNIVNDVSDYYLSVQGGYEDNTNYDFIVDGICYKINNNSNTVFVTYQRDFYLLPNYSNISAEVVIPASVTYQGSTYQVTGIGYDAFGRCSDLMSITIPNSVTTIGYNAFSDCSGLYSLTLTGVGTWNYDNIAHKGLSDIVTQLTTVNIGSGITSLGNFGFVPDIVNSYAKTPPVCSFGTFSNYDGELHVPSTSTVAYFTAPYWRNFNNLANDFTDNVVLSQTEADIAQGETLSLSATTNPEGVNVLWNSSNPLVATVDNNGLVTTIYEGECDIIATLESNAAVYASCHITVSFPEFTLSLSNQSLEMKIGEDSTLEAIITPDNLGLLPTWISSNESVATVENGVVTAVGEGECDITAAVRDKTATCHVIVDDNMVITLNKDNAIIGVNGILTIYPTCTPDLPVELVVTSSDPSVALVRLINRSNASGAPLVNFNEKGQALDLFNSMESPFAKTPVLAGEKAIMIVGVSRGTATITVSTADGMATPATLELRVVDVDGDGSITSVDVTALYNYILNGDETYIATSDIDGDGYITSTDITIIYNIILGN